MLANLNYVHILVATLAYFALGFLWFGLIFGKKWAGLMGMPTTPSAEDKKRMPMMMLMTLVYNFITTFAVAAVLYFVQPMTALAAIKVGLLLGGGISATPIALNYMYAKRPMMLLFFDAGFNVVGITIVSIILTLWH